MMSTKVIKKKFLDPLQNVRGSSSAHSPFSHQVEVKSIGQFLRNPADKQSNQPPDRQTGGKNMPSLWRYQEKWKTTTCVLQFPAGLIHPWTVIYTDWSFSGGSAPRSEEQRMQQRCVVTAPSPGDCVLLFWTRPRAKQKRRVGDWTLRLRVNDEREVAHGQETALIR